MGRQLILISLIYLLMQKNKKFECESFIRENKVMKYTAVFMLFYRPIIYC